jgi:hypothetical protein
MKVAKFGLIAFLIFILYSFGSQKAEWKGTIEEEDGIKVIKNLNEPLYGEITFDLEEDLSIGNEEDENYMFYKVRDIEVDEQGNIFVVDMSNYRIQKFDRNGKYRQSIGRKGQGPGEFEWPSKVRIDNNNGKIYVQDSAFTIEIFDSDGNPYKTVKFAKSIRDFRLSEKGSIIGVFNKLSDIEMVNSICRANVKGEIIEIYAEAPSNQYIRREAGGRIIGFTSGYEKELILSKINVQTFIFGYSGDYELRVVDKKGRLMYKTKKETLPRKLPSRLKKYNLGKYQPYFFLILSDSKGRIYIQTNWTWNKDVKKKEIDIFSKDGFYIYKTTLPKNTYVIRNGYLYALEVKDDEIIKRYKIKNWQQIKKGVR